MIYRDRERRVILEISCTQDVFNSMAIEAMWYGCCVTFALSSYVRPLIILETRHELLRRLRDHVRPLGRRRGGIARASRKREPRRWYICVRAAPGKRNRGGQSLVPVDQLRADAVANRVAVAPDDVLQRACPLATDLRRKAGREPLPPCHANQRELCAPSAGFFCLLCVPAVRSLRLHFLVLVRPTLTRPAPECRRALPGISAVNALYSTNHLPGISVLTLTLRCGHCLLGRGFFEPSLEDHL